jgi:ariadne-1
LIECRRVLKNSYALAYFLQDRSPAKELYEFQQQMLEVNTEELSRLTEKKLSAISEVDEVHIKNLTR